MKKEVNIERGYTLLEPEIYEKLNWDLNLIVLCLEQIRTEIPAILNIETESIEFDLISVGNPHGENYPAIGIHMKPNFIHNIDLDIFKIEEKVEDWINEKGIDNLIQNTQIELTLSWDQLQEIGVYPQRNYNYY